MEAEFTLLNSIYRALASAYSPNNALHSRCVQKHAPKAGGCK